MGRPGPVKFEAKPRKNVTVSVTAQDGQKYEIEMALIVQGVIDTGQENPLDGLPMFQIASQIVTQVKRQTDG
jgi:hypothetical protein